MGWLQVGIAALGFLSVLQLKIETKGFVRTIRYSLSLRHSLLIDPHDALHQHCSLMNATPPLQTCEVRTEIKSNNKWQSACETLENMRFLAPRYYRIESICQTNVLGLKIKYGKIALLIKR